MKTRMHVQISIIASLLILSLVTLVIPTFAETVKLEEGTQVRLRLLQELNSATAQTGQIVNFEVLDNVKIGNTIVIAEGASAQGTVVEAETKKNLGRAGKLAFRLDYVKAVDGSKIPLHATSVNQGAGSGTSTGVLVAGTALVFLPAAPLFLLRKGKDITVPKGHHVDAFIDGTREIVIKEEPAPVATAGATAVAAQAASSSADNAKFCMVSIVADAGFGEIEIDGVFYGSTPSSVRLPAGPHSITVKRSGYKNWEKNLVIAPGNITLRVEMEANVAVVKANRRAK